MANLNLPPNVKQDPNTGLYFITNPQGKTVRVNADTQDQLNQYVNSVNTGVPATVTTTDPNTGNPRTRTFDSNAIISEREAINRQNELLTAGKRQAGVIGNRDGSYQDTRTGETITKEQAETKIKAAGLPPETLVAVTPKNSPAYAAAQASVNQTATAPSNIPPAETQQPSQSEGGNSSSPEVTQSVASPPATTEPPATTATAPAVDTGEVPAAANASSSYTGSPGPVDSPLLTPAESIERAQVSAPPPVDAATFNANTNASVLGAIGVPPAVDTGTVPASANASSSYTGSAKPVDPAVDAAAAEAARLDQIAAEDAALFDQLAVQREAERKQSALDQARAQNTIANQRKNPNNADWRVKLRLAPGANYLYAAPAPGILQPLKDQGGVIFPYTPTISTSYKANYSSYDLTHSNYKGYYYQGSTVEPVTLSCIFTAQSTVEAQYLLAVIHFFKSVTKMFYGQDAERGTPPPLVYLTGLGEYQFNEHACVVQSFTYDLPTDVDYIRARSPNINNSNMLNQRQASNARSPGTTWGNGVLGNFLGGAINRLANAGVPKGAVNMPPAPPTFGLNSPTYVPTKMNIAITLLPVQSRKQQSQQFSLKQYANGDLLKGGFW
jgi:hypothetical protein